MRRPAVIAGCLAALLAGCAGERPYRRDGPGPTPAQVAQRQQWSLAAQAAIDRRDWPRALAELHRLQAEMPRSAEVQHRLGLVCLGQGRLDAAGVAFQRALALDPEYVDALVGLGEVEGRLGHLEAALGRIDAAIEIDPRRTSAHLAEGRVCELLGRTDDALAAYFRALQLDPTSAPALLRAATIQVARGQYDQALARLDDAVELAPDDPESRYQRGRAHLALKHVPAALADLRFAAARFPDRPDVLCDLALALDAGHQRAEALRAAERALQIAPDFAVARDLSVRLRR
jgi:tetratricopeptide (TPR) repeat protein